MLADLRLALRALRRAPGFAAAAVLCLALGVGASAAVLSAVRAVLLHPVATPDVGRLVVVREDLPPLRLTNTEVAPPELFDVAARREAFANVGGYVSRTFTLTDRGGSTTYRGARTLGDYWGAFRVRPQLGRLYTPDDARDAGRRMVAVITDALWRERFGGDPEAVGRELQINDQPYTVVGVLPPEFRYPRDAQLYTPYRVDSATVSDNMRGSLFVHAVARLRDGVTLEQARAVLAAQARSWHDRYPAIYSKYGTRLTATPFVVVDAGALRPVLLVLAAAVAIVLLVACGNVASLQLVRVTARERELAVRSAIGASRARLLRQPLAESLVLAAAGLAFGLALGWALTRLAVRLAPSDQLALRELRLDPAVALATAAVALAAALLAGAAPALAAGRVQVRAALADGARGASVGRGRHRVLRGAVITQGALSTVLLLATGLLVRSLAGLLTADPGFRAERVVTATVRLPFARYAKTDVSNAFYAELLGRLRAVPGVQAAALTSAVPLGGNGDGTSAPFRVIGRDTTGQGEPPHANIRMVSADYFRAMGVPLLRGRTFAPQDDAKPEGKDAAMAFVIDETLARRYFPGEDPVGRRINQGPDGVIVGVVGAVRDRGIGDSTKATVYYNYRQAWGSGFTVVVRSTLADDVALRAVRAAVRDMDPLVPVVEAATLPEVVRRSVAPQRLATAVLAFLTLLTVTLAALGLYGVLAYVVAQRTRELGVRAALGARAAQVAALVLGDGARLAGLGVAAGTLLFLAGGRLLASLLYGVGPRDPLTVAAGVVVLGAVAAAASWLPARRAMRVDPAVALRAE